MKSIRKSAKGFTFVELIVVMAIIAVLTATLVIAVGAFLRDKKYDDANAKAEVVYRALQIKLNQYDAEGHKTTVSGVGEVEGIAGIARKDNLEIYIGNFENTVKSSERIGICRHAYNTSGVDVGVDELLVDFNMGDTIRGLYTKRENANVTWNPSWFAKINMETYTVEYVLYTEDDIQLRSNFMDRSTSDDEGYYKDIYEQQSSSERARLNYNVVGCYPMQSFYD